MLLAVAALALLPAQISTTQTTTTTTRRTVTWRDPGQRVTVNAGDRVRLVLSNPDGRPWTALRPITKSVILVSPATGRGRESVFEYTTSAAARSTLEFRHPSGQRREVKLTVAARTPERTTPPKTTTARVLPPKTPARRPVATITEAQADKTITVRKGDAFEIRLEANATTAYQWRFEPLPEDLVSLKSSTYVADPAPPGVLGSGGTQVFRFVAAGRGTGDVDLVYEQPFNRGKDVRRFHFVLEVR